MKGKVFTAQEVQAILNGSKVMFREVMKLSNEYFMDHVGRLAYKPEELKDWHIDYLAPYQVGQKIFVKESFYENFFADTTYKADGEDKEKSYIKYNQLLCNKLPWKSAVHMKQEHSRLTLRITGIKVERLSEISEEDAKAEGAEKIGYDADYGTFHRSPAGDYRTGFICNWNATHKKLEEKFEASPWVWAIDFEVVKDA